MSHQIAGHRFVLAALITLAIGAPSSAGPATSAPHWSGMGEMLTLQAGEVAPAFPTGVPPVAPATERSGVEGASTPYNPWDSYPEHAQRAISLGFHPLIDEIIKKIDLPDLKAKSAELETNYSKPNRYTGSANYKRATDWVKGMVSSSAPNLLVEYQEFQSPSCGSTYRNVLITLPGADPGAGQYLVGGHFDSVAGSPGMDDDGSGSLGSAIMAIAFAGYRFNATLRYILFDGEEAGICGSDYYAKDAKNKGDPIRYYINLDMISFDPNNLNRFTVASDNQYIKDLATKVEADYGIGIGVTHASGQGCNSDHCPFDRQGYDNAFHMEPTFSVHWHKATDTIDKFNWNTMLGVLKVTAGMLATSAGIIGKGNQSVAVRIEVAPKSPTINTTQQQQFDARGYDANNLPAPLPGPVQWSASGGAISPLGLYTPSAPGTFTVTAKSAGLQDATDITVKEGGIVRIEVAPANSRIREHQTVQFTARGCDASNQCNPITPDLWSQSGGGPKATIDIAGLFTPDGAAVYRIEASKGALVGSADITVDPLVLQSMTLKTSDRDCVPAGPASVDCAVTTKEIQLSVEAVDDQGQTITFDPAKDGKFFDGNWKIDPSGGPIVRADMVVTADGVSSLPYMVKYIAHAFNKDSSQLAINFVPGPIVTMKLLPESPVTLKGGDTQQFTVEAKDARGFDIVKLAGGRLSYTWSVNPSVLGPVDKAGMFTAQKKGIGKVLVKVRDSALGQTKDMSDDTPISVTSDAPGPGPDPTNGTSGFDLSKLAAPLLVVVIMAVAAVAAVVLRRGRRRREQQAQAFQQWGTGYYPREGPPHS